MAKTLIAFSGRAGDFIAVEGTAEEINGALAQKTVTGRVKLTHVPVDNQRFDPGPVFVNPQRVAYIRSPGSGG